MECKMGKIANVIYNGKLLPETELNLLIHNRGFLYGDGFFESMRFEHGKILRYNLHYDRLLGNIELLQMDASHFPSSSDLNTMILDLVESNHISDFSRVRLNIFRESTGAYTPENNTTSYLITCTPLDGPYVFPTQGLKAGIYNQQAKASGPYSCLKSLSSLFYVMAGIYCRQHKWDEVLVMNTQGNIIESLSSNFFIVKNNILITPPLSEGCINGVLKMYFMQLASQHGIECREEKIHPNDVLEADEIILTNAVKGVQWVEFYEGKEYGSSLGKKIFDLI